MYILLYEAKILQHIFLEAAPIVANQNQFITSLAASAAAADDTSPPDDAAATAAC